MLTGTRHQIVEGFAEMKQLFDIIDFEKNRCLTIDQFLDGICKYQEDKVGFLLTNLHRQLSLVRQENTSEGVSRKTSEEGISRKTSKAAIDQEMTDELLLLSQRPSTEP